MTTHEYARKLLALPEVKALSVIDGLDPTEPTLVEDYDFNSRIEYPSHLSREEKDIFRHHWMEQVSKIQIVLIG